MKYIVILIFTLFSLSLNSQNLHVTNLQATTQSIELTGRLHVQPLNSSWQYTSTRNYSPRSTISSNRQTNQSTVVRNTTRRQRVYENRDRRARRNGPGFWDWLGFAGETTARVALATNANYPIYPSFVRYQPQRFFRYPTYNEPFYSVPNQFDRVRYNGWNYNGGESVYRRSAYRNNYPFLLGNPPIGSPIWR